LSFNIPVPDQYCSLKKSFRRAIKKSFRRAQCCGEGIYPRSAAQQS